MTSPGSFPEPSSPPPGWGEAQPANPGFGAPAFGSPGFGAPAPGGMPGQIRSDLPPTAPEAYGLKYWPAGTPGWPALASPWKRLGATLLDGLLLIVTLYVGWFIWNFFTWSDGQSPAKKILKMRVLATTTGRPATWGHMILREWVIKGLTIGLITIITLYIGFFVAALMVFGAYRQTLWDRIAHTVVVDEKKAR